MDFFVCYFCVGSPSIAGRHVFSTGSQMSTKDWKMAVALVHHQFQFNVKMVKHKCHHGHNHHSTTHHNQGHLVDHDHDEGEEEAHLSQEAALVGGGSRGPVGGTCIPRNMWGAEENIFLCQYHHHHHMWGAETNVGWSFVLISPSTSPSPSTSTSLSLSP